MRKIITGILFGVMLAIPIAADVGSSFIVLGTGAPTSGCAAAGGGSGSCAGTANGATVAYDISKVTYIRVQAYCLAGPCTGTITVNVRSRSNVSTVPSPPFQGLIACTNVDPTTGKCSDGSTGYMNVPVGMQLQVQLSGYAAGTFGAILETHTVSP